MTPPERSAEPGLVSSSGARIVLLERPGCHLCEEAAEVVSRVAALTGEEVERVNIEADDELARRWSIEIPVVAVDGEVVAVYRVNDEELKAALVRGLRRPHPLFGAAARISRRG